MTALRSLPGTERDPHGRSFAVLADVLRRAGRVEEGLEVALRGLELHPRFPSGHVATGLLFLDLADPKAARAAFDRALVLDTENHVALAGNVEAALVQGDLPAARRFCGLLDSVGAPDPGLVAALRERIDAAAATPAPPPAAEAPSPAPETSPTAGVVHEDAAEVSAIQPTEAPATPEAAAPDEAPEGDALASAIDGVTSTDAEVGDPATESLLTRTLAELLLAQGLQAEALDAFRRLAARRPDDTALAARLAEVRSLVSPEPGGKMGDGALATSPEPSAEAIEAAAADAVPVEGLAPDTTPVEALAPDIVPVEDLRPETRPIADLGPEHRSVGELGPDPDAGVESAGPAATPIADLAPETTPVEDLAPKRTDPRLDEEFRRWLEGLDA